MKPTQKQQILIDFARQNNNQITTTQAIEKIGHTYYHNGAKHTGEVLSRLVKSGVLIRVKMGCYELVSKNEQIKLL